LRQQIGKQTVVGWLDGFADDVDGGDRGVDGLAVAEVPWRGCDRAAAQAPSPVV